MIDHGIEGARLRRDRELEHHLLRLRQAIEVTQDLVAKNFVGLGALRALDVHFRLDDRHEAVA